MGLDYSFHIDCLILVIDTNNYAGNFEREMIAFCTGLVGDCGVGEEQAEQFEQDESLELNDLMDENLLYFPDDHGCSRPATIWQSESGYYNSVACFISDEVSVENRQKIIEIIKQRSQMFADENAITILGYRLFKRTVSCCEVKE